MSFIQTLTAHRRSLFRAFRLRSLSASYASKANPEEYEKRNYASNVSEYNTVIASLIGQRRFFLLRDVYEDMMLDAVQPVRDTFHSLISGTMKGGRLEDAFFFREQMKIMGLIPDVGLYNLLIATCGKCQNSEIAIQLLEEMNIYGVKPNGPTYICLLNACAAAGRLDRVYAIVRDMTAAGIGLDRYCYSGLINAYGNKKPQTEESTSKIIELVKQSKGWSQVETMNTGSAENLMIGVSEEDLYSVPTAEFIHRRVFVNRQLTVYHAAFHACVNLRSIETMETLLSMLAQDNHTPDLFIVMQIMRCYLYAGDITRGQKTFQDYLDSGKPPAPELFVALAEGAMIGRTPQGMQVAQDALEKMNERGFFLSPKMGNELLLAASQEKTGGFTTANFVWDLMQTRRMTPSFPAVKAYYDGLKQREIPADDPRLLNVTRIFDNLRRRASSLSAQ